MTSCCQSLGIPERLHTKDRQRIIISINDSIYRRVAPVFFQEGVYSVSASAFPLKNDSYNLKSLCECCTDVLYSTKEGIPHYCDHGIIEVPIGTSSEFTYEYTSQNGTSKCILSCVHVPEHCMYPHSEIHVYIDGDLKNPISSKQAKNAIRLFFVENLKVVKHPILQKQN